MKFLRILFQVILGAVFGAASAASLSPLLASFAPKAGTIGTFLVFGVVTLMVAIAPSIRRAFGRSFLFLGAAVFLLPLSTMVLSGVTLNETVDAAAEADKGYAAVGGVMAGGLMTAFAGFVGFILGSIFLLVGLILSLGGRREVIVVEQKSSTRREPTL
jgi:hypothetical protein